MAMLVLLVVVGTVVWVGADASKRDWSDDRFVKSTTGWVLLIAQKLTSA
jgi:hypothetical protein